MNPSETVVDIFSGQAKKTPDAVALKFKKQQLTYRQLEESSNQLAHFLTAKRVHKNDVVAICLNDGIDTIMAIVAILKSGATYMPIDAGFPESRMDYMLSVAAPKLILTNKTNRGLFDDYAILVIEDNEDAIKKMPVAETSPKSTGDFSYVLFTSGSTGRPKGVLMRRQALDNLITWQISDSEMSTGSRTLHFSPVTFDVSFQEIFATLCIGGTLYLIDDELRLDSFELLNFISANKINRLFLPFVALQAMCDIAVSSSDFPQDLKEVMTAGEQLKITPQVSSFFSRISGIKLFNQYGPTEAHVVTSLTLQGDPVNWQELPSIGKPITHVDIYLLNEQLEETVNGEAGELYIGGSALAEGYISQPLLTSEKFIEWKRPDNTTERIYKTGDLAKMIHDGNIQFLGRADEQVKVRGYRIELGEIETCLLQNTSLSNAIVIVHDKEAAQQKIVAYLVSGDGQKNTNEIRSFLQQHLPDYMIPSVFIWMDKIPKTASGKVDKKALPNPDASALLTHAYVAPVSKTEQLLAELWKELLSVERAGAEDNFFELGGTSLPALKMAATLKSKHQINLPIVKLYQFPKIKDLAAFIDGKTSVKKIKQHYAKNEHADVAVIGMSGRFPGADSIEELWELLKEGKETISFFTDDELDKTIPASIKTNPDYVKSKGIIKGVKEFDAAFFGINPNLAKLMDPQQRVFLEIAWEALEQSGYAKENIEQTIGVFAGVNTNTYYTNNVLAHPDLIENTGSLQTTFLNDKDYVATRTSYTFDLKGLAVNVQTACSTSLVAVAQAVQSIRNGQCDMALAGGASINVPVNSGHLYEEGAMFSKDGHCRPFDADATGTSFSDGAGVVLLKNKERAIKDGDTIYGVIKGIGLSNDGGGKGSFMAPSAEGQASAISMAMDDAGIDAKDISYIEAHGTATPLGDPIEVEGLSIVFGEQNEKQYCAIGSVKSNFGHLTIAAGVAGLIKTCLSLHHKKLLPSINYEKPNPHIDFENSPFYVNANLQEWNTDKKRIAGVSAFGVGGTNAHVIVEEADTVSTDVSDTATRSAQLICWSARSDKSLDAYGDKLADYLSKHNSQLADVAYTLNTSRKDFEQRRFIVASGTNDFATQLADKNTLSANTKKLTDKPQHIVFMFPGQGDQYVNMCKSLYQSEKIFKAAVDECATLLKNELNESILDILYPEKVTDEATEKIRQTRYSQPALFTIGYALGKLWMSRGIYPSAFVGHSIGEFVAAYFAGVFTLKDALKLIATRGRMMNDLPPGSMLSVRLSQEEIKPYLNNAIELAAANSPQLCVVAGTNDAIAKLSEELNAKDIPNRILATSHAFHSYMMDDVVVPFEEVVRTISLNEPLIPIASSVTGEWLQPAEATNPHYWAKHLRMPVLFGRAVQKLMDESYGLFLELGPGKSVATLARQQAAGKNITAISSIEKEETHLRSDHAILKALGQLWLHGVTPDWSAFYRDERRKKLFDLPTYAFDKQEYWVDAIVKEAVHSTSVAASENDDQQEVKESLQTVSKKEQLITKIKEILENASGIDVSAAVPGMSFIQIGLDSLSLTQVSLMLKKQFAVSVTFRQLNEELSTIELLADYLEKQLPTTSSLPKTTKKISFASELSIEEEKEIKKPFGAIARIDKKSATLNESQQQYLAELTQRYNQKTKASKEYTQQHRAHMADPRVVSGFKPATKELAYSVVVKRSKGSRLWDIDGNEYIDALNGFGSSMLGYQPDFLKKALIDQIENGYEIGPQHELAGEVCKMICEFTSFDRSALCNTGSEAVLGAMRIARTVTGRSLIVAFTNSYHGIIDEVIARSSKKLKTYPAAPGIMPEAVQNMLFLDYGTEESLRIIEERSDEIAAVLVEPVQSRRCDFQPVAFLKQLRKITAASDAVLIFDEVISGFRFHTGGVQAMFGIQADVATYGKVVGGGMSVGVIAGKKQYMDALDGGRWQFGDDSIPEAGVTYFAGTFVRHPLALATTKATLEYFKQQGPSLQQTLNSKGKFMADALNAICRKLDVPVYIAQFASIWRIHFIEEYPFSELFFVLMRLKGLHILEGFPCFITTAHTDADLQELIRCFEESLTELKQQNLIPYYKHPMPDKNKYLNTPPVSNAKLGKDKDGNPAWFVPDESNLGKWLQVADAG